MDLVAVRAVRARWRIVAVEMRVRRWRSLNWLRSLLDRVQRARPLVHVNSRVTADGQIVEPDQIMSLAPGEIFCRSVDVPAPFDSGTDQELIDVAHGARFVVGLSLHSGRFVHN